MYRGMPAALVVCALVVGCGSMPAPTNSNGATASPPTGVDEAGFPLQVLGMPVLSVGGANQLIAQGKLDGRVAAVGGYWIAEFPIGCPAPSRWHAGLAGYCSHNTLASKGFPAMICSADGTTCQSNGPPPGTEVLEPFALGEESGFNAMNTALFGSPIWREAGYVPAVLIGHVGDARQWECPAETRADCAKKFVIDRVAWVDGEDLALNIPGEREPVAARMTTDEATAVVQAGANVVVAVAAKASDIPSFDPRLNVAGESVMWLVRTIDATGASADDPTRSATESLVDDATGQVAQLIPFAATDFTPAILHVQASSADQCCGGNSYPHYELDDANGVALLEFPANGWSSGTDAGGTHWSAGSPALLHTGDYVVHAWLESGNGTGGNRQFECQTTVSLVDGQESRVQADFPHNDACSFVDPTFDDTIR